MVRQSVCGSSSWLEYGDDAGARRVHGRTGGCLAAGVATRQFVRNELGDQFSMRSNWSTLSARMPNIKWHSTLA